MMIVSFYLFVLQISGIDHSNVMFHLGGGGTFYICCIFITLSLPFSKHWDLPLSFNLDNNPLHIIHATML